MPKYKTKQRDEILGFFLDNEDKCFSAREVCKHVTAGEATVFRTISALTDEGKLNRFTGRHGEGAFYQINSCTADNHIHLKCNKCGQLIHMDCSIMGDFIDHFKSHHGFKVDCSKTVIYGICGNCADEDTEADCEE